jgi:hypothetical protein
MKDERSNFEHSIGVDFYKLTRTQQLRILRVYADATAELWMAAVEVGNAIDGMSPADIVTKVESASSPEEAAILATESGSRLCKLFDRFLQSATIEAQSLAKRIDEIAPNFIPRPTKQ